MPSPRSGGREQGSHCLAAGRHCGEMDTDAGGKRGVHTKNDKEVGFLPLDNTVAHIATHGPDNPVVNRPARTLARAGHSGLGKQVIVERMPRKH